MFRVSYMAIDATSCISHCQVPRKKRPKPSVMPNPPRLTRLMVKLWEMTVEAKNSSGRQISSIFMLLPTRRELPEYYQIIKKPIDLKKIKVRVT